MQTNFRLVTARVSGVLAVLAFPLALSVLAEGNPAGPMDAPAGAREAAPPRALIERSVAGSEASRAAPRSGTLDRAAPHSAPGRAKAARKAGSEGPGPVGAPVRRIQPLDPGTPLEQASGPGALVPDAGKALRVNGKAEKIAD